MESHQNVDFPEKGGSFHSDAEFTGKDYFQNFTMQAPTNVNPLIFPEQPKVNGLNRNGSGVLVAQGELMEGAASREWRPEGALMNDQTFDLKGSLKLCSSEDSRKIYNDFPRNHMNGCGHDGIPLECEFSGKTRKFSV